MVSPQKHIKYNIIREYSSTRNILLLLPAGVQLFSTGSKLIPAG